MRELTKVKGKFKGNEVQMQREIKFRGLKANLRGIANFKKEWVYGYLFKKENDFYVIRQTKDPIYGEDYDDYIVSKKSIGEYTGLKDKRGKDIYEGDIIRWICIGKEGGNIEDIGVTMDMGRLEVVFEQGKFATRNPSIAIGNFERNEIEVIGNIYEHPKLIPVATVGNNKIVQRIRTRK